MITVSLGSGNGDDVDHLFMKDICGNTESPPRHARAFGNLRQRREELRMERVSALTKFREAAQAGQFPGPAETPNIGDAELETFMDLPERDSA